MWVVFAPDLSFHSVAVGSAVLCSQRWISVTVAFIGIWGNFPCLFHMFTNTTLNCFGFGMSTVGTAVFDCICWLVPVATDSSVFTRSNIVWNRWKSTLKARSISEFELRNANVNTGYFIHQGKYSKYCKATGRVDKKHLLGEAINTRLVFPIQQWSILS